MPKVYVVEGETGQYSDHSSWLLPRVFLDREMADAVVKEILDEVARVESHGQVNWWSMREADIEGNDASEHVVTVEQQVQPFETVRIEHKLMRLDPGFSCDYNGVKYTVHELELVGHAEDVARAFGLREST